MTYTFWTFSTVKHRVPEPSCIKYLPYQDKTISGFQLMCFHWTSFGRDFESNWYFLMKKKISILEVKFQFWIEINFYGDFQKWSRSGFGSQDFKKICVALDNCTDWSISWFKIHFVSKLWTFFRQWRNCARIQSLWIYITTCHYYSVIFIRTTWYNVGIIGHTQKNKKAHNKS